ncbi:hypothetical protein NEOC95_000782 [Neochlamydia sp. AcF95]|nr:hypothetical protein [Neochlamydia sp. AcF95]
MLPCLLPLESKAVFAVLTQAFRKANIIIDVRNKGRRD